LWGYILHTHTHAFKVRARLDHGPSDIAHINREGGRCATLTIK